MDRKFLQTFIGISGVLFWFSPLTTVTFRGYTGYQAGYHIGGIAYLLLLSSAVYTVLSWYEQHQPRLIAAGVATGLCLLFLFLAGASVNWGLLCLLGVSGAGAWFAWEDIHAEKTLASREEKSIQ